MSDFYSDIHFTSPTKTAAMDDLLKGSEVACLTDRGRVARATASYLDGDRVVVDRNNGLLAPQGLPRAGTKGTVVSVHTASGEQTSYEGDAFVKWDGEAKVARVPLNFVKKASIRVSNLDDFVMLGGNASLQAFASEGDSPLVHKATRDLWSMKVSEDGSFDVERLFDGEGNPLKV